MVDKCKKPLYIAKILLLITFLLWITYQLIHREVIHTPFNHRISTIHHGG